MRINLSSIAQAVHDYLLSSYECDAKGWVEFSKGRCKSVPFTEALWVYSEEVDYWINTN